MNNTITSYNRQHIHICRAWRKILLITFAIIIVVTPFICQFSFFSHRYAEWEDSRHITEVTVSAYDTLDEFGYQYKPEWMDIREYRHEIVQLNNLTSDKLCIGQTLKFYVVGTEYTTVGHFGDTIITADGSEWSYDNTVRITFNDNGTPNDITDDIIVDIAPIH